MSCIVWNCRGLGNQLAIQELVELVQAKAPAFVFLVETLADEVRLNYVKERIRFDHKHFVPRVTRGSRLVLYWRNDIEVEVISSSLNHIDVIINKSSVSAWRFTRFYGEPETHKRHESWDLLRRLYGQNSLPWLCADDFNEVTKQSKKSGGRLRPCAQMQLFREVLDECNFMDLGFKGSPFTWSKHYHIGVSIWERLDRVVATAEWFLNFPGTRDHHVNSTTSDHKLLWIEQVGLEFQLKKKPFRFEEMWLADIGCGEIVEGVWQASYDEGDNHRVLKKIDNCGKELTRWSKECFGNVRKELDKKRKELARAEKLALQTEGSVRLVQIQNEINVLMGKEERMWRQRSRASYLKDGDRNTCFFHCKATQRKRRNHISGIRNQVDVWCTEQSQISDMFLGYYNQLFTSSNPIEMAAEIDSIPSMVIEEMNGILISEFQPWEIDNALKQMAPLKAPGPDGMPPLFYQNFWDLVRGDVSGSILNFLNSGSLPSPLNHTFVTLISKTKNPERVTEFRPISLCNVLYKIFSKVLANRLKKVLPHIISEHQSAFIKGRLITDNILVAYETFHYMKNHNSRKSGYMALKLDMSKAYDRVEWSFLKDVMVQMGFHE